MKKTIIKIASTTLIVAMAVVGNLTAGNSQNNESGLSLAGLFQNAEAVECHTYGWGGSVCCYGIYGSGCNAYGVPYAAMWTSW